MLADELHFGRTAERIGISQPGVSEAVRVLESRLGVKVFDRTSRRVSLTPAGEALRHDLEPALDAYRPLRRGDIDVLCNWLAVDEPDLVAGATFARYQRALAVAATHRLAARPTASIEDLADEEVALLPPSTPPAVYDLLIPPRTPSGRPIRRTQPAQTVNEVLSLVARAHRPPHQLHHPHLRPQ